MAYIEATRHSNALGKTRSMASIMVLATPQTKLVHKRLQELASYV